MANHAAINPPAGALGEPLVLGEPSYGEVTDAITRVPLSRATFRWLALFGIASLVVMVLLTAIAWVLVQGVGVWGVNIPVAWGFAIINFVWWIGIGHAGTLISAILLLLRQRWRNSINRLAEAMTLVAVANAGMFPLLHLGRPWLFFYLLPYPNTLNLWPQWRSPLVWDVFAVLTYFTVSLIFWYVGLIPDLATMRDAVRTRFAKRAYGILSLGWRNAARHWQHHQIAYLILAGISTPLVVSVHSIVSLDFAVSIVPGWHSTIFPPYFVAGAIYSGFAMVFILGIPLRAYYGLHSFITARHLNNMAKVMLVSGLIVAYGYAAEAFIAFFSGELMEQFMMLNRAFGPYGAAFWALVLCNVLIPQALWFSRVRTSPLALFALSIVINIGMWLERFVIVVVSLHRDYMPSAWGMYWPTVWDWALFVGTLGFFLFCMMLFVKLLPAIPISEVRELLPGPAGELEQAEAERFPHAEGATPQPPVAEAPSRTREIYGLMVEFDRPQQLLTAARRARDAGYTHIEAYTPFPLEDLPHALGHRPSWLPAVALLGAVIGASSAYFMMWYSSVISYPINVGGKPFHSWPSFIPITFELGVLSTALFSVFGMAVFNGLPHLYHPVFNVPQFERASRDRFFLVVESRDPNFDEPVVSEFLRGLDPIEISEVEA